MTDDRGAGRHTGHAFVVNRRDDVEAADRALRGIGVTSRDGKLLGQATRSEWCYAARRLCAVTPVDARCVMAGAGSGSRIGGIWLRSGRIGESGHRLRPGVGADVDLNGEAAGGVHRLIADANSESLGVSLAIERVRDGNCHRKRSLLLIRVVLCAERSRASQVKAGVRGAVAPIHVNRPWTAVRIAERAKVK